jgi:hypothetical protein
MDDGSADWGIPLIFGLNWANETALRHRDVLP